MAETATISFDESRAVDRYAFNTSEALGRSTVRIGQEQSERGTSVASVDAGAAVYRSPDSAKENARQAVQRMVGVPQRDTVRVDVRGIEEDMVVCQILGLGGQDVMLQLPSELFPNSPGERRPYIGASYNLKMEEVSGIRKPVLTWFEGSVDANSEIKRRISDRIRAFTQA